MAASFSILSKTLKHRIDRTNHLRENGIFCYTDMENKYFVEKGEESMFKRTLLVISILILSFCFSSGLISAAGARREFPLGRDVRTIHLTSSNGTITWKPVDGWQRAMVVVESVDLDSSNQLRIENDSTRYALILRTDGTSPVHFTVYAPPEQISEFRVLTSNGSITIEADFKGMLNLETSNGSIILSSGSGQVHLKTSNGSINLGSTRLTNSSTIRTSNGTIFGIVAFPTWGSFTFENSNGRINLRMPPDTRGIFDLSTVNGTIDFSLGQDVVSGKNSLFVDQTRVNRSNGPNIVIKTSNGDIFVQEEYFNYNWKF